MNERGRYVRLPNLVEHLSAKPSIGTELDLLKSGLSAGEMGRSIWMVHQPPSGLGMDILGSGQRVGSPTVLRFIQENQPLLGCSGHIHESPYQRSGKWMARVGTTVWVQPGQMDDRLHFVSLEITDNCSVAHVWHSVLGPGGF